MRVATVVRQQVSQIKWHALASLALIMVLPLEEATASLLDGGGFYPLAMVMPSIMLGPLLAGLIACANVQADLNDRRYIFWRSKPVGVKRFIALKYATGLIIALLIQACPIVFAMVTSAIYDERHPAAEQMRYYIMLPVLLSVMTYSLCFACNILVRKTARSWLIGMAVACLLLLLPFVLPLGYKDVVSDVLLWASGFYLAIMLVGSVGAFVFAILAAQYDLHLKTNLKGLLWTGAALVFGIMMLFASQVANIKVLAEKGVSQERSRGLERVGEEILLPWYGYVNIDENTISFTDSGGDVPFHPPVFRYEEDGYSIRTYPYRNSAKLYRIGSETYSFAIHDYYVTEDIPRKNGKVYKTDIHEKLYLRSFRFRDNSWDMVCELDISDCLENRTSSVRTAMRFADNRIDLFVNRSYISLDATNPAELRIIDKKLNALKRPVSYLVRHGEFGIPLLPIEEIGTEERIKLSIDFNYGQYYPYRDIFESSTVDVGDESMSFFLVLPKEIVRFDVVRWDDEKVWCKFGGSRPFTVLERLGDNYYSNVFVKKGRLYICGRGKLLVFDVRSAGRIRKIGHFVRMGNNIDDIEVLENGNILLSIWLSRDLRKYKPGVERTFLYLLESPG